MRIALLALLLAAACGYRFQDDRGQERLESTGQLPKVALIPFDNATFRRFLEIELSRLLADELRARSPRAPYPPSEADWLLEGSVVQAVERVLSENTDGSVRESSFVVTVEVVLREAATDKVIGTYSFEEREPFSEFVGRIRTLEEAETQALRDIAESIVYWLEASHPERAA